MLGACAGAYCTRVQPPSGFLYSHIRAPLDANFDGTPVCEKVGVAKTQYVFVPFVYLSFAWEDAMIKKAAEQGQLTTVEYADYEFMNILGIYSEFTVRAYGR